LIFRESTTIGVHWRIENKVALAREFQPVQTTWGAGNMKIARWHSGKIANASPEYEDCRQIAERYALPLKHVMLEVQRIFASNESAKVGN
jgi:uncharacterized protein (DUF111 family)